ncbi:MAG: DNA N-6-adenine-methyltransferase, partial [Candidatus Thiodiazotropha sp.]
MADESELGWKVVDEYLQSEIASDEEDQKKIHRAQARARVKVRSERGKRSRRWFPYRPRSASATATETTTAQPSQTQQQQQQQKRPGLCFLCGQAGHWKMDCPTSKRNFKLSENSFSVNIYDMKGSVEPDQSVHLKSEKSVSINSDDVGKSEISHSLEFDTESKAKQYHTPVSKDMNSEVSPYNRLKNAATVWLESGASSYILDVVQQGYKIPFKELPPIQKSKNNKSARENPDFVSTEIKCLLAKGCISKVEFTPHVVNPLTVAYNKKGKPRLVLDCRNINKCLHTFKFKYEDMNTARQMFKKGTYMFSFDIRGAYNHIDIFLPHRTFLGFAWIENGLERFYVYNSLPFGLATAGHIFSKVLRAVVTFWRSVGHKVITFLDDGLGGDTDYEIAVRSSCFIRKSIQEFGFLLANEKCEWLPKLQITWLGYFICMATGRFFITDDRIKRLEISARSLLGQLASQELRIVPARFAASIAGLIISMQMVMGKLVRLKTRELYKCIDSRLSWDSPVYISEKAEQEVRFWLESARLLNAKGMDITENLDFELMLFCDASSEGYGGFLDASCFRRAGYSLCSQVPGTLETEVSFPETELFLESEAVEAFKKAVIRSPEEDARMSLLSSVSPEVETGLRAEKMASNQNVEGMLTEVRSQKSSNLISEAVHYAKSGQSLSESSALVSADQSVTEVDKPKCKPAYTEVIGVWNQTEKAKSSTWREAEAAKRIMASNVDHLRGKSVRVLSDNKNVESVLQAGSQKEDLQKVALEVNRFCDDNQINLSVAWIPRSLNEKADYLSRCKDSDDWEVENSIFQKLDANWGPYTVDRYASHYNNKCERFNSRWWVPGTEGVNALHQNWSKPENNWLVPPPRLVLSTIEKMAKEQAVGTILLPNWPSAPFYPSIFKDSKCHSFVREVVKLPRFNVVKKGLGNNGIFEINPLPFDMLALKLDFSLKKNKRFCTFVRRLFGTRKRVINEHYQHYMSSSAELKVKKATYT